MKETIIEIFNKIPFGKWVKNVGNGRGSVGLTLESLLGKEVENFELPDYKGIEIKAKVSKKEEHITLFSSVPDSYLFEIKRINDTYGYPDSDYPQFNVFNAALYGNRKIKVGNYYFTLYVDYQNKNLVLRVYNNEKKLIDDNSAWSFDILQEKLERKLNYLAIAKAERKYELGAVYFRYNNIKFYKLISFERFLKLIEMGFITVNFRIGVYKSGNKFGKIYDHGTSFNINEYDIEKLFNRIILNDQGDKKKNLI